MYICYLLILFVRNGFMYDIFYFTYVLLLCGILKNIEAGYMR